MKILKETQQERDEELSKLTGVPIEEIQKIKLCEASSIRIFEGERYPKTQKEYEELYRDFKHLNLIGYLKTLMYTSTVKRASQLYALLPQFYNVYCLDFGAGVGTHSIALLENDCTVDILDVEGPLQSFAKMRVTQRSLDSNARFLKHDCFLPQRSYDFVICADVLEHVYDPCMELNRIIESIKIEGLLHLEVSTMIKPSSGHFAPSIEKWKTAGKNIIKERLKQVKPTIFKRIK